jgi:hypothetical protein
MRLISETILTAALILTFAVPCVAQDPAAYSTQPTDWDYFGDLNSSTIQDIAHSRGMRIVSAKWWWHTAGEGWDKFGVILIKNSGDYLIKNWWWYPNLDEEQLNSKINYHHARILHLDVRVNDSGKHYFSAVLVDNTGSNAKDWWWYFNVTPTYLASLAQKNNARIVELVTYWDQNKREVRRAGVMIANTGADKTDWRYLFNMPAFAIPPFLSSQKMRLLNLQIVPTVPDEGVLYDLLAEKDQGQQSSYFLNKDYEQIRQLAQQRHTRPFSQGSQNEQTSPFIMTANAATPGHCGQNFEDPCCQGFYCTNVNLICDDFNGVCHNRPTGGTGTGTGTGTGPGTGTGSGNNQPPCGSSVGAKCCPKDQCGKGFACNVSSQTCVKVGPGCGGIGQPCCPPSSANPEGCSLSKCSSGVCQPCGNKGEICCGGTTTTLYCGPGLNCNGVDCH